MNSELPIHTETPSTMDTSAKTTTASRAERSKRKRSKRKPKRAKKQKINPVEVFPLLRPSAEQRGEEGGMADTWLWHRKFSLFEGGQELSHTGLNGKRIQVPD